MRSNPLFPLGFGQPVERPTTPVNELIENLKLGFKDPGFKWRENYTRKLAELGRQHKDQNQKVLDFFIEQSGTNYDPSTRRLALLGLLELGHVTGIYRTVECLSDNDNGVRDYALAVLASCDNRNAGNTHPAVWGSRAFDSLVKLLGDENNVTRANAAVGLGKIKDARAGKALVECLNDPDKVVRHRATWALGEIGTDGALKALGGVLHNTKEDAEVRQEAYEGINKINESRASRRGQFSAGLYGSTSPNRDEEIVAWARGESDTVQSNDGYGGQQDDYLRRLQEDDDSRRRLQEEEDYQRRLREQEEEDYRRRLQEEEDQHRRQEEEQQTLFNSYFAINPDDPFGLG